MVSANTAMISTGGPVGSGDDGELTFESYMARFENSNMYFTKLEDFAKSSRLSVELRGKAINMAIAKAKTSKKVG